MKHLWIGWLLTAALGLSGGCRTPEPAQGLDRAVSCARAGIQEKFPTERQDNLRLDKIILLDHSSNTSRAYMVVFEDVASIQVTTNDGVRSRTVRRVDAHVTDGIVTSVGEGRGTDTGRVKR